MTTVDFGCRIDRYRGMNPELVERIWAERREADRLKKEQDRLNKLREHMSVNRISRPDMAYIMHKEGKSNNYIMKALDYGSVSGVIKAINRRKRKEIK